MHTGSILAQAARTLLFGMAVWLLGAAPTMAGETRLADPPPSFDTPRRIVMTLSSDDAKTTNGVLSNLINVQKFYGVDNVELVLVAYGGGLRALLRDDSTVSERISSLQHYGITFIACGNTLTTLQKTPEDLLAGVQWVPAGIPEVVERQLDGWIYIHP